MPRRRLGLRAASLAVMCAAASAIPMNDLFARQSSCAANFNKCREADFPDNFCCPSGQNCIPLAANTTILCCPNGSDCSAIEPLPCNVDLQDASKHPEAVVKTTALGATMARCGSSCCPFGYSCRNNKECVKNADQKAAPLETTRPGQISTTRTTTSTTSSTTLSTTASTATSATSSTETASTTDTAEASTEANGTNSGPPIAAIAGGAIAGAIVLIIAIVVAIIFLKKKKASEAGSPPKLSRSTSSFGNFISGPIMAENATMRADFARAPGTRDLDGDPGSVTADLIADTMSTPESRGMPAVPPAAAHGAVRQSSVAYGYGALIDPSPFADTSYGDYNSGGLMPQTPQRNREPSSVSINVFADPNITPDRSPESNMGRRYSDATTFTQMLDRADLGGVARGESYVPYDQDGGHPPMPRR